MATNGTGKLPPRKLFINNEYTDSKSHLPKSTLFSPVDDSLVVDDVIEAGTEDIDRAVLAAHEAFRHGPWPKFTAKQRGACLNKFADLLEREAERLAYAEALPTGRPLRDIINFDLPYAATIVRYYAGWVDKIAGKLFNEDDGILRLVRYEPLGVCAAISPWNTTANTIALKVAPALAAGNTVVFKPSEKSPLGALAIAPLFAEAGFPPGVVQFVTGGANTGRLLASHMQVAKVSLTGSLAAGRAVQEAAARSNMKKVTLELGGKAPAVVFEDADVQTAAGSLAGFMIFNCGQVCIAPSRVLVQESIAETFIGVVKATFEGAASGLGSDPLDMTTQLGPLVDKAQFDRVMSYVEAGKSSCTLVTGGRRVGTKGCFLEPTLFVDPKGDSRVWREEIFGPVLTIKTFKTEAEAIELANDTTYGLSASVFTKDVGRALRVSSAIQAGGVSVNTIYMPGPQVPFGGTKLSGQGREMGDEGIYSYVEPKAVIINTA